LDVCEFIVSENKQVIGLSSVCVCVCVCDTVYNSWKMAFIWKFHMEVCNSYSKCPVRPHKLPVPIIQVRMKIILDTCLSAFFLMYFFF